MKLKEKILNTLRENNLVKEEDLKKALHTQQEEGGSLGEILVRMGLLDEKSLLFILSKDLGIPPIELSKFHLSQELLNTIPYQFAAKYKVIPVGKLGNSLTVAMADPLNIFALDDLARLTKLEINPVLASPREIEESLHRYYQTQAQRELENILQSAGATPQIEILKEEVQENKEVVLQEVREGPIVRVVNLILKRGVESRASDILIEPTPTKSRIRFRIDGVLREEESPPLKMHPYIVSRIKVMTNLDIAEHRLPQDGRFRMRLGQKDVDFRVSIIPSIFGEKVALRVLDKTQALLDLDALGFEEDVAGKIKRTSLRPYGMIISCGPTGCGKTTTLYSILKYLHSPQKNIITVEDPVEYELKGINQVQARSEVGLTFARCLRAILRQDPDIIMVGEIRDFETVDIAIKAALTGHLVLTTLHTTTAAGAVTRFVNMGVEYFLVASSLLGVIAQRLVRRLCPDCKEPYKLSASLGEELGIERGLTVFRPRGCQQCAQTGYRGRVGICEFLEVTDKIKEVILSGGSEADLKREAKNSGMRSLREEGLLKFKKGLTSLEEVLRVTYQE